jgi:hypothetical protein
MKNGDFPVMLVYQRVRFNTIIIETGIEFLVPASMPTLLILGANLSCFRKLVCELRHFANSWEVNPVTCRGW